MFDGNAYFDGQRNSTLLRKMQRIDVRGSDPLAVAHDDCGVGPYNYAVPSTNPFVGQEPACDEVWLMGLRNTFFFFQAEAGIRVGTVTGVQTCALPIWRVFDFDVAAHAEDGERREEQNRPVHTKLCTLIGLAG